MPRAVDTKQLQVSHDPNRSGTEFHIQKLIKSEAEILAELLSQLGSSFGDTVITVIEEITGLDLSALKPLFEDLNLDFSSPTGFVTSLINAITLLPEVLVTLISALITQLATPGAMEDKLQELLFALVTLLVELPNLLFDLGQALLSAGAGLLGIQSPLNALNLFNLVPPTLLGQIDISHIGTNLTNLLTDPHFLDTALGDITGWVHDLTGGFGGIGSMSTTADGTTKELFGNLIPVSAGQIVPISGKAKWAGLAGTGSPIGLGVTGYLNGSATTQATVASHNTTPATTDWTALSGTYTVPANVDSLRTRLTVGSTATAGTVSFSDLSVTKSGAMLQSLIRGTNTGEFLPDDITHLFGGILTNATGLLTKVEQSVHDALVSTIGGSFGTDLTAAEQRLDDFLHSLSPLNGSNIASGDVSDDFVSGVRTTVTNIFNGLFGLSGTGASHDDALAALQANAHALTDHGAGITNLFGRLSNLESKVSALPVAGGGTGAGTADGGAIGVNDTDTFERTSSSNLGSTWLQFYSSGAGTWAIPNGHDATWAASGLGDREFLAIRNNPAILRSQTDYQRVTQELSSKATRSYDPLLGTFNYTGGNDIWLLVSDATTSLANVTGIRIRWEGDGGLSIVRFINGSGALLAGLGTGGIVPPGPGANLIGEAGVLADHAPLVIRAKIGASIRLEANDPGGGAYRGGSFRRWGHGGRAEGAGILVGQTIPGGLHYWNGMDQTL